MSRLTAVSQIARVSLNPKDSDNRWILESLRNAGFKIFSCYVEGLANPRVSTQSGTHEGLKAICNLLEAT